jgi:hypothetical protein
MSNERCIFNHPYRGGQSFALGARWVIRLIALLLTATRAFGAEPQIKPPPQFATNGLGNYVLEKPWRGEERPTLLTGSYLTYVAPPEIKALEKETRLDLLVVFRNPFSTNQTNWDLGQRNERTEKGWSYSKSRTYRSTLPSDIEIKNCDTVPKINSLLGLPYFADGAPYSAHWSFFTFGSSNTIETLTVSCMSEKSDDIIDSLKVRRGVLTNAVENSRTK